MKNQRVSGIILSYISMSINTVINLLYVPILLYFLGKEEYGLYQLMGSFIAYFSIMDFGLSNTVVRYYSKYKALADEEQMANVLAIAKRIYYVIDAIIMLLAFFIYPLLDKFYSHSLSEYELISTKRMFVIVVVNIIIVISTNVYNAYITAEEKFIFLKIISLIQSLIQPFIVVLILSQHPYAITVVVVQTILNLIVSLIKIYYSYFVLHVHIELCSQNKMLVKGMIKFSISIFVVAITDQLFWKTNQLILAAVSGTIAVAVYAVASQIYMNYVSLSSVIQGVFLPKVTNLVTTGKDTNQLFLQVGRIQFMILSCVCGGFIVYGKEFILIWVGKDFLEAYYITLIMILAMTIDLIQSLGGTIMQAKNIYQIRAKVLFVMAILNIAMAFLLGEKYGGIGCAVGTSSCMIIGNGLVMNQIYKTKVGLDINRFWKSILRLSLCPIITILITELINSYIREKGIVVLALKILLFLIIYGVILWKIGFTNIEKQAINQVFFKRTNKKGTMV